MGILHRQRGKPSNRWIADKIKQKVLPQAVLRRLWADLGQLEAHERHQIDVHPETLRLWLRQARLPYNSGKPDRIGSGGRGGAALVGRIAS